MADDNKEEEQETNPKKHAREEDEEKGDASEEKTAEGKILYATSARRRLNGMWCRVSKRSHRFCYSLIALISQQSHPPR